MQFANSSSSSLLFTLLLGDPTHSALLSILSRSLLLWLIKHLVSVGQSQTRVNRANSASALARLDEKFDIKISLSAAAACLGTCSVLANSH